MNYIAYSNRHLFIQSEFLNYTDIKKVFLIMLEDMKIDPNKYSIITRNKFICITGDNPIKILNDYSVFNHWEKHEKDTLDLLLNFGSWEREMVCMDKYIKITNSRSISNFKIPNPDTEFSIIRDAKFDFNRIVVSYILPEVNSRNTKSYICYNKGFYKLISYLFTKFIEAETDYKYEINITIENNVMNIAIIDDNKYNTIGMDCFSKYKAEDLLVLQDAIFSSLHNFIERFEHISIEKIKSALDVIETDDIKLLDLIIENYLKKNKVYNDIIDRVEISKVRSYFETFNYGQSCLCAIKSFMKEILYNPTRVTYETYDIENSGSYYADVVLKCICFYGLLDEVITPLSDHSDLFISYPSKNCFRKIQNSDNEYTFDTNKSTYLRSDKSEVLGYYKRVGIIDMSKLISNRLLFNYDQFSSLIYFQFMKYILNDNIFRFETYSSYDISIKTIDFSRYSTNKTCGPLELIFIDLTTDKNTYLNCKQLIECLMKYLTTEHFHDLWIEFLDSLFTRMDDFKNCNLDHFLFDLSDFFWGWFTNDNIDDHKGKFLKFCNDIIQNKLYTTITIK